MEVTGKSLVLPLHSPQQHMQLLHPANFRGTITIAEAPAGASWRQETISIADIGNAVERYAECEDVYISMNRFKGARSIANLLELSCLWVDLDYYKTDYRDVDIEAIRDEALKRLKESNIPSPNICIYTGRGLSFVWLHEPVPRVALPRWRACQKHINQALVDLGSDAMASDGARVMRLAGTVNSKTGKKVAGIIYDPGRQQFDKLADEILPMTRAEIKNLRLERAKLRATRPTVKARGFARGKLTAATLWEGRLSALQYWRQSIRHKRGKLPPGERDNWLFWTANAMAYLVPEYVLEREIIELAGQVAGWEEREAKTRIQAVLKRARALARGETIEWMGEKISPLYRARNETILECIGITEDEQRQLLEYFGKPILCNKKIVREYKTDQEMKRRRQKGAVSREEYEKRALMRRKTAIQLQEKGLTYKEIAAEMKISQNAVKTLLKRGRVKSVSLYGGVARGAVKNKKNKKIYIGPNKEIAARDFSFLQPSVFSVKKRFVHNALVQRCFSYLNALLYGYEVINLFRGHIMNKAEWIKEIASRLGQSQAGVSRIMQESIEIIKDNIKDKPKKRGEDFKMVIPGFGTFYVVTTAARTGKNPQTGKPVKIPAKRVLKFRMSKTLKEEMNK